jgi:hypothetical protein
MKIALYIEDGLEQIVLTPTSDSEKCILAKMHETPRELHVTRGEFYKNFAGFWRQGNTSNPSSTIIVLRVVHDAAPVTEPFSLEAGQV